MRYEINWTLEAQTTLNENIEYLFKSWDLSSINIFLDRVDEVVNNISDNPNLYPVFRKADNIHKCVVNKHITLYYKILSHSRIDLITFWNTHQNPSSLNIN